jgi:hypothetical protein
VPKRKWLLLSFLTAVASCPVSSIDAQQTGVASSTAICGAPAEPVTWENADTVAVILFRAEKLWLGEQEAFRDYQRLYCRGCDFLAGEGQFFFASSTHLLARLAEQYPEDARTQCAFGEARIREASLGEGDYDLEVLRKASPFLERAAAMARDPVLAERVESLRGIVAWATGGT